jgi:cytochrome c-type biogenesis protein
LQTASVPVFLALAAGILSFLSPCQLAVLPGYVGYLSGSMAGQTSNRARTLSHAVAFVAGFSIVLIVLGASVGLVGYLIYDYVPLLRRLGGTILIVFGLHLAGIIRIPFLYREAKLHVGAPRPGRYTTSFTLGLVFGVGWTPCIGPTLAAILLMASTTQTVLQGGLLLTVYCLGLGIPFLITAVALDRVRLVLKQVNRRGNLVSAVSGVLLIGMGILIFTDQLTRLSAILGAWAPFNV